MRNSPIKSIFIILLLAGCGGITGDRVVVSGAGPEDLLKLRYGPSLSFRVKLGFPDGTELELVIADDGDDLDDTERAALHAALSEAWKRAKAGELHPAKELLDEL